MEREIRHAANNGEFDKNLEQLDELKTLIDMSDPINRQWVLRTEGMARYRLGQIGFKEYEELILQGIIPGLYTFPVCRKAVCCTFFFPYSAMFRACR